MKLIFHLFFQKTLPGNYFFHFKGIGLEEEKEKDEDGINLGLGTVESIYLENSRVRVNRMFQDIVLLTARIQKIITGQHPLHP